MKNFDLEKAKAKEPICTRTGRPARLLDWNIKNDIGYTLVSAIMDENGFESVELHTADGKAFRGTESENDLFMAPVKREGWVNLWKRAGDNRPTFGSEKAYLSFEEAKQSAHTDNPNLIFMGTAKIEWKE